jgi:DNA invertase Pin-like site-specific DNA recombinase
MAQTLAQQLATQSRRIREATARRDELIREMRAEGYPLRTIAEAAGLSHQAIMKIVGKAARNDG